MYQNGNSIPGPYLFCVPLVILWENWKCAPEGCENWSCRGTALVQIDVKNTRNTIFKKIRIKNIWDQTKRLCWATVLNTKTQQRTISWAMVFSEKDLGVTVHQQKSAMPCRQEKHCIKMNNQEYRLWGSWKYHTGLSSTAQASTFVLVFQEGCGLLWKEFVADQLEIWPLRLSWKI